ncbi:MAG: DUF6259 domain-containing protein, partial [Chloroflexi bacterium]|nr:DUF6259 domain-containing protein [Chloroflexota bacterium]
MAQVRLSTGNDRLVLENEHVRFVFARQRGWQLVSMRHAASGHEFIEPSAPTGPLWSIQFLSEHFRQNDIKRTFEKGVQQEIHGLDSTTASACQFSSHQDDNATTLIMTWSGLQIAEEIEAADVVVEVSLAPDALYAEWRLAVKMYSPRVGVQCVDFPLIGPLAASPRAQLAVPNGWGQLIPDPTQSAGYHGHFPCGVCDMQTANLCDAGIGLYLTAHDPHGNDKEIVFTPDAAQHTLTYKLVNYPTGMGTISLGQDYAMPFAGAVGAFSGDWLTGAKIYRDWLPNAIWWSRQSVAQRADIPDWIKETTLWLQSQGAADDAAPKAKAFAEFFDVPTATHWYSWHQIPFDDHYPEYFPAKPGFAEGVRAMREAGVKVMPYINGRLWDPRNASWREEKAAFACAKDSEGHKYVEVYASKVELA